MPLMAMDNKAFEAWKNKDAKFFEGFMADSFLMYGDKGKVMDRAESIKMISEHKCDVKSFALSEPHVTAAGPDVAVLTFKAVLDGTCEGTAKIPSPVTGASVYVHSGDTWKAAYHNEVAVMEPKPADEKKEANSSAAAGEEKKPAAAADVAKKEAPAANTVASNSTATAPAASSDALTAAIMAVEKKGWEAWMKKDAKAMEEVTTKDLTFVDVTGRITKGQADVIKLWTGPECKVTSVNVSDGKATMIANNVAILTFRGTAEGTCGTMKIEPLWGTTVAVKDGDTWRAVYIFETPAS